MQYATESGSYNGWSIDAIQEQKMGVTAKTDHFNAVIEKFSGAMDKEDFLTAKELYYELKKMVNPESYENKLLDMDMEMIKSDDKA